MPVSDTAMQHPCFNPGSSLQGPDTLNNVSFRDAMRDIQLHLQAGRETAPKLGPFTQF